MNRSLRRLSLVAAIMLSLVASTALAPSVAQAGPTVCNPGQSTYKVTSTTLKAKVTKWRTYSKNDHSKTKIKMTTKKTSTLKTSVTKVKNIDAGIVLKQVVKATVGKKDGETRLNEKAKTYTYSEEHTLKNPGDWVIASGHSVGIGHVIRSACKQDGSGFTRVGQADGKTYKKAQHDGLINCKKKANNKFKRAAKAKCPS